MKPYCTHNNDSLFTCYDHLPVLFNILALINLVQLNILCTSTMKLYYAKNNNSLFMCFQIPDFIEKEI